MDPTFLPPLFFTYSREGGGVFCPWERGGGYCPGYIVLVPCTRDSHTFVRVKLSNLRWQRCERQRKFFFLGGGGGGNSGKIFFLSFSRITADLFFAVHTCAIVPIPVDMI